MVLNVVRFEKMKNLINKETFKQSKDLEDKGRVKL